MTRKRRPRKEEASQQLQDGLDHTDGRRLKVITSTSPLPCHHTVVYKYFIILKVLSAEPSLKASSTVSTAGS